MFYSVFSASIAAVRRIEGQGGSVMGHFLREALPDRVKS
jgi:hypothetical protein